MNTFSRFEHLISEIKNIGPWPNLYDCATSCRGRKTASRARSGTLHSAIQLIRASRRRGFARSCYCFQRLIYPAKDWSASRMPNGYREAKYCPVKARTMTKLTTMKLKTSPTTRARNLLTKAWNWIKIAAVTIDASFYGIELYTGYV